MSEGDETPAQPRPARDHGAAGIVLRGAAMGIAELVPGVSGGTIAFVSGIYARLVGALYSFDRQALSLLIARRPGAAFTHVDGGFLVLLACGMVAAALAFASVVGWLFEHHEIELWAFFFGLIVASIVFVSKSVDRWSGERLGLAMLGMLLGAVISNAGGLPVSEAPLVTFAAGAVAVCAWILPGVSGSFVLLLLGQYQRVVRAVSELDLVVLGSLAAGCAIGLLLFTRALSWLLAHFYGATLAFLCGFMAGSLQKLWPWRQTLSYYLDSAGEAVPTRVRPISPWQFETLYGDDPVLLAALASGVAGIMVVASLERLGRGAPSASVSR